MRTRQRGSGGDAPRTPWDEIAPGLWMGGHVRSDAAGGLRPVVVDREFDLVVSLASRPGHGPHRAVEHLLAEIPDGPLSAEEIERVQSAARTAACAVRDGRTVLVRCHHGLNRSGLVVAQALIESAGLDARSAVALVRERRSPRALNNETFVHYLTTGLDVASLLTGLESPC
ncbi:dual specificity protein phosphatase family protein [Kitasatospora sp. NPDC051914]|uniref:protein-tyrosine phosphatase family protein n=1 Tax=Kitasatospora sp. NPDC051914 TaxID=3154945 RepID=UPI0034310EF1